jgi:hypothetical protein
LIVTLPLHERSQLSDNQFTTPVMPLLPRFVQDVEAFLFAFTCAGSAQCTCQFLPQPLSACLLSWLQFSLVLSSCNTSCLSCWLQDKFRQKQHFEAAGVPVAPYMDVADQASLMAAAGNFGYPFMLKSKR